MASIRRISNTIENIKSIGNQINPFSPENTKSFQDSLSPYNDPLSQFYNAFMETGREIDRIDKAEREERLKGILTVTEMENVERFVEEAYFLLDEEYKNKKAKEYAEETRRLYALGQIPKVETITEIKVEELTGGDRKERETISPNVTVIVLKAPKHQSDLARAWFQNFISILTREKIFGVDSQEIKGVLGSIREREEIRVYIEKEYSTIHWKTIREDLPEDQIINEFDYDSLTWDDYPLFEDIENEIFLRDKEESVRIDFIKNDIGTDTFVLNFPLLFEETATSEEKPNSEYWPKVKENGEELSLINTLEAFRIENYEDYLKREEGSEKFLIDIFLEKVKATKLIDLLKSIRNFYGIDRNETEDFFTPSSRSTQAALIRALPFIKYKIASKLLNAFHYDLENPSNNTRLLKKGILKQLEEEKIISTEEGAINKLRVFYIKDEEAGELVCSQKVILDNYLKQHSISFKQVSLSDGILTLPLEGLRYFFISLYFGYSLNNFIMKRFKNKDFFLKYYYNYVLDDFEEKISNNIRYETVFKLPRNIVIKAREDFIDENSIGSNVLARVVRGQDENSLIEIDFNNQYEDWLNSDFNCLAYVTNKKFEDNILFSSELIIRRVTPLQFVSNESNQQSFNENYNFTFDRLLKTLMHEHIHVMQSMGTNFFVRSRNFPENEALFENMDGPDYAKLLEKSLTSLDANRYRFFYLSRWILSLLKYPYMGTFFDNGISTSIKNFDDGIKEYKLNDVVMIDGVNYSDFINDLVEELYDFYKFYKGIFFAKGQSYIGNFLKSFFTKKGLMVGSFSLITEGIATYLVAIYYQESNKSFGLSTLNKASHFYSVTSNEKYLSYLNIIEKLDELAFIKGNPLFKNILSIFSDINFGSYVKDDYFKKEEILDDGIRSKNIYYQYSEVPDFRLTLSNNDRFDLFSDEKIINNAENNFRINYKSVAPTPVIQRAAAPVVAPAAPRPQPTPAQPAPEDPNIMRTIEESRRLGAELNRISEQTSRDGAQLSQETSDAVNTQY